MQPASQGMAYDDYSAEARERIARVMAKAQGRTATEAPDLEPARLRAFKPPTLFTQKSDPNEQEGRDSQSPRQGIKAVTKRLNVQTAPPDERSDPRNSRTTDAVWLQQASSLTSPARSMSAAEGLGSRERSPPRDAEQSRPRSYSIPAPALPTKLQAFTRLYDDPSADSHSLAERRTLPVSAFEAARGLGRPGSFDNIDMERSHSDPRSTRRLIRPSSSKKHEAEHAAPTADSDARRKLTRPSSLERHSHLGSKTRSDEDPGRPRASSQLSFGRTEEEAQARTSLKASTGAEDSSADTELGRHARPDAELAQRARPVRLPAIETPVSPHAPGPASATPTTEPRWLDGSPHRPPRRQLKPPSFRVHIPSDSSDASDGEELRYRSPHLNTGRSGTASGSDSDTSLAATSPRRRQNSMSHLSRRTSEGSEVDSDAEAGHAGRSGASDLATDTLLELRAALRPRHVQTSPLTGAAAKHGGRAPHVLVFLWAMMTPGKDGHLAAAC